MNKCRLCEHFETQKRERKKRVLPPYSKWSFIDNITPRNLYPMIIINHNLVSR